MFETVFNVVWMTVSCIAFGGLGWWLWGDDKRAATKANNWSMENEWDFLGKVDDYDDPFTIDPFNHKSKEGSTKVMVGTFNGVSVFVGEHNANEMGSKDIQNFPWAMIKVPKNWSNVSISTRNNLIPDVAFPHNKIGFEWGEFNDKWCVRGNNSKFAHSFVTGRMMELLHSELLERAVVIHDGWMMVTTRKPISGKPGIITAMEKIMTKAKAVPKNDKIYYDDYVEYVLSLAKDLTKIVALAPPHLWSDQGDIKPVVTNDGAQPVIDEDDENE